MENDILSKKKILELCKKERFNFSQILRSSYKETYDYLDKTFTGKKFSEKVFKYVHGLCYCRKCGCELGSKNFITFFLGYDTFCSMSCNKEYRINKGNDTKLKLYGDPHYRNPEKTKETMFRKYGVEHNWASGSISREVCKKTNMELYGHEWGIGEETKRKMKNTSYERYGNEIPQKTKLIKDKIKNSHMEKYGMFYNQTDEFKEQCKKTCMEKYGVEYSNQNAEIFEKSQKNMYSSKKYCLPSGSGKIIKIQGYENYALDILLKTYDELDIIYDKKYIPVISYEFDGKMRKYFPDFYIKKDNLILEVKSEYTESLEQEKNNIKMLETIKSGFKYKKLIFNKKGEVVNL